MTYKTCSEELGEKIAELEAKLDVFDEMDEMLRICLNANVDMAEKLDRVRGLPTVQVRLIHDGKHVRRSAVLLRDVQSALGDEE